MYGKKCFLTSLTILQGSTTDTSTWYITNFAFAHPFTRMFPYPHIHHHPWKLLSCVDGKLTMKYYIQPWSHEVSAPRRTIWNHILRLRRITSIRSGHIIPCPSD